MTERISQIYAEKRSRGIFFSRLSAVKHHVGGSFVRRPTAEFRLKPKKVKKSKLQPAHCAAAVGTAGHRRSPLRCLCRHLYSNVEL
jgi:hypothetical protein